MTAGNVYNVVSDEVKAVHFRNSTKKKAKLPPSCFFKYSSIFRPTFPTTSFEPTTPTLLFHPPIKAVSVLRPGAFYGIWYNNPNHSKRVFTEMLRGHGGIEWVGFSMELGEVSLQFHEFAE